MLAPGLHEGPGQSTPILNPRFVDWIVVEPFMTLVYLQIQFFVTMTTTPVLLLADGHSILYLTFVRIKEGDTVFDICQDQGGRHCI